MKKIMHVFILLLLAGTLQAGLVEDFEGYTTGDINNQGVWKRTAGAATVVVDPTDAENQVLKMSDSGLTAYMPIPTIFATSTKATVKFRFYAPTLITGNDDGSGNVGFGLSDETDPVDWNSYGPLTSVKDDIYEVRDDGDKWTLFNREADTWYTIWLVMDQTAESLDVYVQGGVYTTKTKVYTGAKYRNFGTNNSLKTFLVRTNNNHSKPVYLDDIEIGYDRAWSPIPEHNVDQVATDASLNWKTGLNPDNISQINPAITKHIVYMVEYSDPNSNPSPFMTEATRFDVTGADESWTPVAGTLKRGKHYYWRVDELLSGSDVIAGAVWHFESVPAIPTITAGSPENKLVDVDDAPAFTVIAENPFEGHETDISYQWYLRDGEIETTLTNGAKFSGVTTDVMTIVDMQVADEGIYFCRVTNIYGNTEDADSRAATLAIKRKMAHWTLDSSKFVNGQYVDETGDYNADKIVGVPEIPTFVESADGTADGALVVDPNTCATAGTWNPSEFSKQVTVSAWIKWDGEVLGQSGNTIVEKLAVWGDDTMMWKLAIREVVEGKAGIRFYNAAGIDAWAKGIVPVNEWVHVCATFASNSAKVYINGIKKAQHNGVRLSRGVDAVIHLGNKNSPFPGAMDDMVIYNYALDKYEVADAYIATAGGYLCIGGNPEFDLNEDCQVDLEDLAILANNWLESNHYSAGY